MPDAAAATTAADAPDAAAEQPQPEAAAPAADPPVAPEASPTTTAGAVSRIELAGGETIRVAASHSEIEKVLEKAGNFIRLKRAEGDHFVTIAVQHITHFFGS
jgi:hypothetical protein